MPKRIIQLPEKEEIDDAENQFIAGDGQIGGTFKMKVKNAREVLMPPFPSHVNYLTEDYTLPEGRNAVTVSPLFIPSGVNLDVPNSSHFYVIEGEPEVDNQEPMGSSQVLMGFAEAVGDLSNSIGYMWLASSSNSEAKLRYRAQGTLTWHDVPCEIVSFPQRSEKIHKARIGSLMPNTTYELRPYGAPLSDIRRIKTTPSGQYEPKVIHISDYQTNNYTPGAQFELMNQVVSAHLNDVHLIVGGGDYTMDDGLNNNLVLSNRWYSFLQGIDAYYKRLDGTLIPWVWLAGNHEVVTNYSNVADPTNPVSAPGYLAHFFQFLWDQTLENSPVRGHGWIKLGSNLLLIFLDSNHSSFLTDQLDSFEEILEEYASSVRHVTVVSHVSPWRGQNTSDAWIAHRQLRRQFLPLAEEYPNFKLWMAGHDHNMTITYPIKTVTETGNEYKWERDLTNGVITIGNGGWATISTGNIGNKALASPVDGTLMYQAYIDLNSTFGLNNAPTVAPTNASPYIGAQHFWKLSFNLNNVTMTAISYDNKVYKTATQNL